MHKLSLAVSLFTLAIYVLTLLPVSYVGVYLTYVAVPLIVVFGLIAYFSTPSQVTLNAPMTSEERVLEIDARLKELGD